MGKRTIEGYRRKQFLLLCIKTDRDIRIIDNSLMVGTVSCRNDTFENCMLFRIICSNDSIENRSSTRHKDIGIFKNNVSSTKLLLIRKKR